MYIYRERDIILHIITCTYYRWGAAGKGGWLPESEASTTERGDSNIYTI